MKKFSYEIKRYDVNFKYVVTAETKEEAVKKIEKICGEKITGKIKEE